VKLDRRRPGLAIKTIADAQRKRLRDRFGVDVRKPKTKPLDLVEWAP
jgi:hypothetical protein